MQIVQSVKWSLDNKYILSGSAEMNIRVWKAKASEKLGVVSSQHHHIQAESGSQPAVLKMPVKNSNCKIQRPKTFLSYSLNYIITCSIIGRNYFEEFHIHFISSFMLSVAYVYTKNLSLIKCLSYPLVKGWQTLKNKEPFLSQILSEK